MGEIVENVVRVRDMIGEIASASGEQADGVKQINAAVANLDQLTQQNAALVEESAAAASSMNDQADRLAEVVRVFRVDAHSTSQSSIAQIRSSDLHKPGSTTVRSTPVKKPVAAVARPVSTPPKAAPAKAALKPVVKVAEKAGASDEWEAF